MYKFGRKRKKKSFNPLFIKWRIFMANWSQLHNLTADFLSRFSFDLNIDTENYVLVCISVRNVMLKP